MGFIANSRELAATRFILTVRFQRLRAIRHLTDQTALVTAVSALVHELQKERGMTNVFLSSGGAEFRDQRSAQIEICRKLEREVIDSLAELDRMNVPPRLLAAGELAIRELGGLDALRDTAQKLGIEASVATETFCVIIDRLLSLVIDAADVTVDADVSKALIAYVNLMRGKEAAGQERAVGAAGFGAGSFDAGRHRRMARLAAMQKRAFEVFAEHAAPEQVSVLETAIGGAVGADVERFRAVVREKGLTGELDGCRAPDWFAAATRRIDALKGVEDRLAADLRSLVERRLEEVRREFESWPGASAGPLVRFAAWRARRHLRSGDRWMSDTRRAVVAILSAEADSGLGAALRTTLRAEDASLSAGGAVGEQQRRERALEEARQRDLEAAAHGFTAAFEEAMARMMTVSSSVDEAARRLDAVAGDTDARTVEMAATADQSRMGAQSIATAADVMAGGVREVRQRADVSVEAARQAMTRATSARDIIHRLSEATGRVDEVVELINAITAQTNMLALNATIEAARAGDLGKGFAVVAGEVKSLAARTAEASREISRHVAGMREGAVSAVSALDSISEVILDVDRATGEIAESLARQDVATQQIAAGIQQVAAGTEVVGGAAVGVRDSAAETGVVARDNLNASRRLSELVTDMRENLETFLRGLRAA